MMELNIEHLYYFDEDKLFINYKVRNKTSSEEYISMIEIDFSSHNNLELLKFDLKNGLVFKYIFLDLAEKWNY